MSRPWACRETAGRRGVLGVDFERDDRPSVGQAGGHGDRRIPGERTDFEHVGGLSGEDQQLEKPPFLTAHHHPPGREVLARPLEDVGKVRRRGGGSIVMIASIWGRESGGRMTYNAVKAAEISLAKSMAQQLARDNIRVNSVAPGSILFPGGSWDRRQKADPEAIAEFVRRELPFARFGRPEDVA